MIISRTPFRISFAGGGSDIKEYYLEYGGSVLSTSIDKYIYLSMHKYFNENKFFLKYSKNELVDNVDKIDHKIIKCVLKDYRIKGIDFNSSADIPSGTGLASSSAFTVGLSTLCNAYTNKYLSKENVAKYACDVEIKKLNEPIGKQDQYACAIGGLNFIEFNQDDSVSIEKIILTSEKTNMLDNNLLMFYLGSTRLASDILIEQKENILTNKTKVMSLHKIVKLSQELKSELSQGNIDAMGDILHRGWMYKKELASKISNDDINYYYNLAIRHGAMGGKLLGAGGNGFLLFYVPSDKQQDVRNVLKDLQETKFSFEQEGSKILYYNDSER